MAGDLYDLDIGPDELSGVKQLVRVQMLECTTESENGHVRVKVRLKAIGGGPTNVPRWQTWPTLVFDATVIDSMRKSGQLQPVVPTVSESRR
jgi:hypothetical protein